MEKAAVTEKARRTLQEWLESQDSTKSGRVARPLLDSLIATYLGEGAAEVKPFLDNITDRQTVDYRLFLSYAFPQTSEQTQPKNRHGTTRTSKSNKVGLKEPQAAQADIPTPFRLEPREEPQSREEKLRSQFRDVQNLDADAIRALLQEARDMNVAIGNEEMAEAARCLFVQVLKTLDRSEIMARLQTAEERIAALQDAQNGGNSFEELRCKLRYAIDGKQQENRLRQLLLQVGDDVHN